MVFKTFVSVRFSAMTVKGMECTMLVRLELRQTLSKREDGEKTGEGVQKFCIEWEECCQQPLFPGENCCTSSDLVGQPSNRSDSFRSIAVLLFL